MLILSLAAIKKNGQILFNYIWIIIRLSFEEFESGYLAFIPFLQVYISLEYFFPHLIPVLLIGETPPGTQVPRQSLGTPLDVQQLIAVS